MKNQTLSDKITATSPRSAWQRGVKSYALEMIESAEQEITRDNYESVILNGARTWKDYSYGGCADIYDADIAERLCSPSELKRKRGGDSQPNPRENWLDVQARALFQASNLIRRSI